VIKDDERITEPLCANPQCKYHKYIVDARLRYVQVVPEPNEAMFMVDNSPPIDCEYAVLTVERVPLFYRNRKIGMYCVDCAKEIIGKEIV